MYKIKEFSTLSKLTIKTLRYYERENLLTPSFVDQNGYRYYDSKLLIHLAKVISLRQIGFSINEIKEFFDCPDKNQMLKVRKDEIEKSLIEENIKLSKINYLLEEKNMKYEVIVKKLPDYIVYYKDGVVKDFTEILDFILGSAEDCKKINPNIKCIEPDYCYLNYLDGEYKGNNFRVRYAQAVKEAGKDNDVIKFMKLEPVDAVCIYHKGSYDGLRDAYAFIMNYIEENGYEVLEDPRERYIDGMWNKEDEADWLTEIQVPVKKK